jgi:flagellar basal-body rod protein FlgC
MALENILSIAGSGLSAQSVRLNTVASNLANAESVSSSVETTYRARMPIFEAQYVAAMQDGTKIAYGEEGGMGVNVAGVIESDAPLQRRYQPDHPYADEEGYVSYPNVNVVEEMVNMISASRSFQNTVEVMNTTKQMMQRLLTLGQ